MAIATKRVESGREPFWIVELDMHRCPWEYGSGVKEISHIDRNKAKYSETVTSWNSNRLTLATDVTVPPTGRNQSYIATMTANPAWLDTDLVGLEDNKQYVVSVCVNTSNTASVDMYLYDGTAAAYRGQVTFSCALGIWTKGAETVGTGDVTALGAGWYLLEVFVPAGTVVAANNNYAGFDVFGAGGNTMILTGMMVHQGTTTAEYELTTTRDGTYTNVTLSAGGQVLDALIGLDARFTTLGTQFEITDNGTGYVRIEGDPTGTISVGDGISWHVDGLCTASETGDNKCFKTAATCNWLEDYGGDPDNVQTIRLCSARANLPASLGAFPCIESVQITPQEITRGGGLGMHGKVQVTCRDFPYHDRGLDPFVDERTYDPNTRGTFWGKFRARHKYYHNRIMRVYSGYLTDPIDLTNFRCETYALDSFSGPNSNHKASFTGKDLVRETVTDDAVMPKPALGTLAIDMTTTTPGIMYQLKTPGGDDYNDVGGGYVRIDSEIIGYANTGGGAEDSGVGGMFNITRGMFGTTVVAHTAGAEVQQCIYYDDTTTVADILDDALTNYTDLNASYFTPADWDTEFLDWAAGHVASTVLSEPTSVRVIFEELTVQYLFDMWWDPENVEVLVQCMHPHITATSLTNSSNIVAGSFRTQDKPDERKTQVWVYWGVRDMTGSYSSPKDFYHGTGYGDLDAQDDAEYGDTRVLKIYSRWIIQEYDAYRLATRLLGVIRDTPAVYTFDVDAKDGTIVIGDYVTLDTAQDATGASDSTDVLVVSVKEKIVGHLFEAKARNEGYPGRYGLIAPNGTPDYDAASDDEKQKYVFFSTAAKPQLNGDGPYRMS